MAQDFQEYIKRKAQLKRFRSPLKLPQVDGESKQGQRAVTTRNNRESSMLDNEASKYGFNTQEKAGELDITLEESQPTEV